MSLLAPARVNAPIERLEVHAFRVPTEGGPESDGTIVWDATTLVLVEVTAGDVTGIGYTYADVASARVILDTLRDIVVGGDALYNGELWVKMSASVRNLGRDGVTSMAISAVDVALWDLKGKLLGQPVCALLGMARAEVPIYGSGGFTSYDIPKLQAQLSGWADAGIPRVKMKIGRAPAQDLKRVAAARAAIGNAELFVDANGAYSRKQALEFGHAFVAYGVAWYEEPVYHEDFQGLALLRNAAPASMEITSGEYGYGLYHFGRMLDAQTVDVLQADATRCGGFSGLLAVDGLCQTKMIPLSTHCAPYLHLHAGAALKSLRHMEYFFDHARIEKMFFDGIPEQKNGTLAPDLDRPGIGLEFRCADALQYEVSL
ncbi:MAG: enolase C-terminal domain-like protein [Candidatus Baltobacteraceae bacterium]